MERMFSHAKQHGHECYISRQDSPGYMFASYKSWRVAADEMRHVRAQFRNLLFVRGFPLFDDYTSGLLIKLLIFSYT